MPASHKNRRLNLRVSRAQNELIRDAAREVDQTTSAFVLTSVLASAENVLADRVRFRLDERRWREFTRALDRPARSIPQLRRLLHDAD